MLNVHGWAIGKSKDTSIDYKLLDEAKNSLDFELVKRRRDDVSQIYFGAVSDRDFGFDINFDYNENKKYLLIITFQRFFCHFYNLIVYIFGKGDYTTGNKYYYEFFFVPKHITNMRHFHYGVECYIIFIL